MSTLTAFATELPEISDELLDLLSEAGRTLSDVLVEQDGVLVVDQEVVDSLRGPVVNGPAFADLLGPDEVEDAHDGSDMAPDDFDFAAVVAGLDLLDTNGSLATLLSFKGPYTRAARRAASKRTNVDAEFYNALNGPLFRARERARLEAVALEDLPADERTLSQTIAARRARWRLEHLTELIVRLNYGMTRKYVRLFTSNTSREDSDDFQGAAILGLMNSIDTFDPDKGKFGSWAYKRIQREVLRAVREADYKSMNHGDFERRPDVLRAYGQLAGPNADRTPSFEEVAGAAGCTVDLVKRVLAAPHLDSIHETVGPDGDTELGDLLPDGTQAIDDQVITAMDVASLTRYGLSVLDPRERYVLSRRFGLDGEPVQCLSSIGTQLKLSREAVRQIESKALARLLHPATLSRIVRHGR